MKVKQIIFVILLLLSVPIVAHENVTNRDNNVHTWYVGGQIGMPMAEAGFSSFGVDKFRPGWNTGISIGYCLTPIWSMEITSAWGQLFLTEQDCCHDRKYFLGTDLNRYRYHIPEGLQGWFYRDLKSRTFVQHYGFHVNMDILNALDLKVQSWGIKLSPLVSLVGTNSDLITMSNKSVVVNNLRSWHLGYGGQVLVSYAIKENINLCFYGGYTQLTGNPMDGMPELHITNYIVDAGVKISYTFQTPKKTKETTLPIKQPIEPVNVKDTTKVVPPKINYEDVSRKRILQLITSEECPNVEKYLTTLLSQDNEVYNYIHLIPTLEKIHRQVSDVKSIKVTKMLEQFIKEISAIKETEILLGQRYDGEQRRKLMEILNNAEYMTEEQRQSQKVDSIKRSLSLYKLATSNMLDFITEIEEICLNAKGNNKNDSIYEELAISLRESVEFEARVENIRLSQYLSDMYDEICTKVIYEDEDNKYIFDKFDLNLLKELKKQIKESLISK